MNRTARHSLQGILDDFWQQPLCLEGKIDGRCNGRYWRPCKADAILKSGQPCQPNDDYEKLSASRAPDAGSRFAGTPSDFVGNPQPCSVKYVDVLLLTVARPVTVV
jgi:hypothetical protein